MKGTELSSSGMTTMIWARIDKKGRICCGMRDGNGHQTRRGQLGDTVEVEEVGDDSHQLDPPKVQKAILSAAAQATAAYRSKHPETAAAPTTPLAGDTTIGLPKAIRPFGALASPG